MSKKGIDVSEFQGKIDWEKVKNDGIEFAILRCGYGMDFSNQDDVEYERNANECERLGIPYGVYLMSYANTVEKARSEAKHVLRLIEGRKISLGVWHDIEDNGTSGAINKETLTNIINTFCNTIKNAGYKVGVYANLNWLENKIEKTIKDNYDIWVAQYYSKCEYEGKYIMWQHTSSGKVNGISTNVDMNILYEDLPVINNNDNNNDLYYDDNSFNENGIDKGVEDNSSQFSNVNRGNSLTNFGKGLAEGVKNGFYQKKNNPALGVNDAKKDDPMKGQKKPDNKGNNLSNDKNNSAKGQKDGDKKKNPLPGGMNKNKNDNNKNANRQKPQDKNKEKDVVETH